MREPEANAAEPFWQNSVWWRRSVAASSTHLVAHGLLFVSGVIAARGLGPAGYGVVVMALSVAGFIVLFLDFSLEEALVYFGKRHQVRGDVHGLANLFATALRLDVVFGVAAVVVVIAAAGPIARHSHAGVGETLIVLAAVQYLATTIDGTTGAALLVTGRPDLRAWNGMVAGAVRTGLISLALALGHGPVGVVVASILSAASGSLTQGYFAWTKAWRAWGVPVRVVRWFPSRKFMSFALLTSVTGSVTAATAASVPLLVGLSLSARAVSEVAVGMMPLAAAALATTQIRLAALPEQSALWAGGAVVELRVSVTRFSFGLLFAGAPLAAALYLLMPVGIPLIFGAEFTTAVRPAQLLLMAMPAQLVSSWLKMVPTAVGRPAKRTGVAVLEFGLTAAAVGVLAAVSGRDAAVIGYVAAQISVAAIWALVVRRVLGEPRVPLPGSSEWQR